MDRSRPKSRKTLIKKIVFFSAAAIALVWGGITIAKIDFSSRRVDRDNLLIETVQRGAMEIKVSANGQLLPKNIEIIASQIPGRVAKLLVQPGDTVAKGQVMAELTNPQLIASAEEAFSAWEGAVADQQSFEVDLQNSLLNQESITMQAKFAFERAQLQLQAESQLIDKNIIPEIDFKRTKLNVAQLQEMLNIEAKRLEKSRSNMEAQLAVKNARVTQFARALDRANNQVEDLQVIAGIDGIVQAMDIEVGEQLVPGSPIGKIAQQDQLYAELKVPARQAGEVGVGQNVLIDTRNGMVNGTVDRIDPGVTDGTVIVDVNIDGDLPRGARPQLQVEGIIYIAQIEDTLYVGKPNYIKADATVALYKLDSQGQYAQRVNVDLGKVSVNHVQIVDGLQPGDQIITSDSSDWQDHDRILLN
jgi:multidrug resistance efflux pump